MKKLIWVLGAVALAGCATSSGTNITDGQLAALKARHATIQEVTEMFGPPSGSQTLPDGERILTYSASGVSTDAAYYIPVVGPLVGHSGFSVSSESLTFSPNGRLVSYQSQNQKFGNSGGTTLSVGGH